jgi:hypothetical protein
LELSFESEFEIRNERRVLKVESGLVRKTVELDRSRQFPSSPGRANEVVILGIESPAVWAPLVAVHRDGKLRSLVAVKAVHEAL